MDVDQFVLGALQEVKLGHYEAVYPRLRDQKDPFQASQERVKTRPSVLGIRANPDCSVLSLLVLRQVSFSHRTNTYK